ncbi:MAG: cell division protein SepF [Butyrivibrio sp.]|nr:cell division protein SepF [Acetatifactor muris]MCM1557957.1 cell division protein SepF [Butyrivibrio sp.]
MGVMDKFLNYMKLNGEDDDEYFDEDYLDDEEEVEPAPSRKAQAQRQKEEEDADDRAARRSAPTSKITPIKQPAARRSSGGAGMEVCVIKPTSVEDAREITETLLANRTVVLNLEGLDVDVAQRIIDFTSGSCYAISGNLQKISHYIFIITPASVDISGDFQDIFGGSFEMPLNSR